MDPATHGIQLRLAAFDHINRLGTLRGGILDSADLAGGFEFGGERIPLINPQRGIFKPRQMAGLFCIRTALPRSGGRVWYDDQREAHRQIYAGDDVVDYQFMGTDPNSADNHWLRDAMDQQIPIIYFLGTSPGHYQAIIPTFIVGWHPERLRVQHALGAIVGASAQAALPAAPERRYALREIKARLRLLELHDGPFLQQGLKAMAGRLIQLPRRKCRSPGSRPTCATVRGFQESRIVSTAPRNERPLPVDDTALLMLFWELTKDIGREGWSRCMRPGSRILGGEIS